MGNKIDKIFWCVKKLNYSLRWFGVGCLLFLTALVVKEVFMRSVFNHPSALLWNSEELSRFTSGSCALAMYNP